MEPSPENSISSITRADLAWLRRLYVVEPVLRLEVPKVHERANRPPAGRICLYEGYFWSGLGMPFGPFITKLLLHMELAPAALTPHSWRCISGFHASCMLWEVEPTFPLFQYLFSVSWAPGSGPCGWFHITWRGRRGIRKLIEEAPSFAPGWKTRFFFVSRSDGEEWHFPAWGVLHGRATSDPPLTREIWDALDRLNGPHAPPPEGPFSVGAEAAVGADLVPRVD